MVCSDIARGGLFLRTQGELPPLFSRVQVTLELARGPLTSTCEVVRLVTPEQARLWGMAPGFGVQFLEPPPDFKAAVAQLLKGGTGNTPLATMGPAGDTEANGALEGYRTNLQKDHYSLLTLPQDASFEAVRRGCVWRSRSWRRLRVAALVRPARAAGVGAYPGAGCGRDADERLSPGHVLTPCWATSGAWRCCLGAGLTVTQMESLRRDFLLRRPNAAGTARVHILTGNAFEKNGRSRAQWRPTSGAWRWIRWISRCCSATARCAACWLSARPHRRQAPRWKGT